MRFDGYSSAPVVLTVTLLVASGLGLLPQAAAESFTAQAVTVSGAASGAAVMAVTPAGGMHIAYELGSNVYHATRTSGVWSSVKVNPAGTSGHNPSLAVNAVGDLTIAYIDGDANLRVGGYSEGSWSTVPVVVGSGAVAASLALDSSGLPQVAVEAASPTGVQIYHVTTGEGGWDVTGLTNTSFDDRLPSIAVGGDGSVHIAYRESDGSDTEIWYATNSSGAWVKAQLTDDLADNGFPSIALDDSGAVHLAFQRVDDSGTDGIYYATNSGGGWQQSHASAGLVGGIRPSLAVDGGGHAYVVFQLLQGSNRVFYGSNAGGAWSSWELSATTQDEELSWVDRALTIDRDGYAHVAFQANTSGIDQVYHARSDFIVTGDTGEGTCESPLRVACGQQVIGDTTGFTNNIDSYGCTSWDESGPEVIYELEIPPATVADVVASLSGLSADLDVYLLSPGGCSSGACVPGSSVTNSAASATSLSPGRYLIAVDGYQGASGPFRLDLLCNTTVGSCASNQTTMCLNGSRFRVTAQYRTESGQSGFGRAVSMTDDTGYFWFFDDSNVEVVVKILRACVINGKYWVFAAGLTNVEVTLTVEDVITDEVKVYTNDQGVSFMPIQDTAAFDSCG